MSHQIVQFKPVLLGESSGKASTDGLIFPRVLLVRLTPSPGVQHARLLRLVLRRVGAANPVCGRASPSLDRRAPLACNSLSRCAINRDRIYIRIIIDDY